MHSRHHKIKPYQKKSLFFQNSNKLFSKISYACPFLFLVLLYWPLVLLAQQENIGHPTVWTDQEFQEQKQAVLQKYQNEKEKITTQLNSLKEQQEKLRREIDSTNEKFHGYHLVVGLISFSGIGLPYVIPIVCLMVLNHFIYLVFREKPFFLKYKTRIVILFFALEIMLFLPLISNAQTVQPLSFSQEPADPLEENLKAVNKLINLTMPERLIHIMESTNQQFFDLPSLSSTDPFLQKDSGSVEIQTPGYYYTLAILYKMTGNEEKTFQVLRNLINLPLKSKWLPSNELPAIYSNTMKVMIRSNDRINAMKTAQNLIEIYSARSDFDSLIKLSSYLSEQNWPQLAVDALNRCLTMELNNSQLLHLAQALLQFNRVSDAATVINWAIRNVRNLKELIPIIELCLNSNSLYSEVSLSLQRGVQLARNGDDYQTLVRLMINNNRQEDAIRVLNMAKDNLRNIPDLLIISKLARENQIIPIAIDVVTKIIELNASLGGRGLPDGIYDEFAKPVGDQPISLSTYLGLLQQLDNRMDAAKQSMEKEISKEVLAILQTYASKIQVNINNYYYLKKIWETKKPEKVPLLLPLYGVLQRQILQDLSEKEENTIREKIAAIRNYEQNLEAMKNRKLEIEKKISRDQFRFISLLIGAIGMVVFIILIIVGCTIKALNLARTCNRFQTFAFLNKFVECAGWSLSFSVIAIPVGIGMIFLSQFMQIFHNLQQKAESFSLLSKPIGTTSVEGTET